MAAERRVGHMALLLSESEAENARLNELANVLKEEIRSNQRSEERMKHIENLEYVKNIIFKVKRQRYTYKVLQTIQLKLILLSVWAERTVLVSAKTALEFKHEI